MAPFSFSFWFLPSIICVSLYAVAVSSEVVFTRTHAPAGWEIQCRAEPGDRVQFIFALKQQHLDVLEAKFWAVSDPQSDDYQNFLSIGEVLNIVAPNSEDVTLVTEWLLLQGVKLSEIKSLGDALEVSTSVVVAEKLFDTQFYKFTHKEWSLTVLRQFGPFSVPHTILSRVDFITGVTRFPHAFNGRYHPIKSPNGWDAIVPQTTYNLYNIGPQKMESAMSATATASSTSQGVIEFGDDTFSPVDMANFADQTGIPITPLTANHIIGDNTGTGTEEGNLDIQFISTVNTQATNWFWIEDDTSWLYTFSTHFFNTVDVPLVASISYGWWELDQCELGVGDRDCAKFNVTSADYVTRVNTEFQKIGLRGVSLVVASGDDGAHTWSDEECTAPGLRVDFPASSPFVTSVGGTQLTDATPLKVKPKICTSDFNCMGNGTEVAVSWTVSHFASGGGFSEMMGQPSYQADAVKAYLASGVTLPDASMYNASGRAHPDIAAVGSGSLIWHNAPEVVGGTSASAPIAAAIISKLNQASIAKSGKPLGFVNPLLYQLYAKDPSAFHDVTVGDNFCSSNEYICPQSCTGFYATKGWDPVTGLGTLNYAALLNYIQNQ